MDESDQSESSHRVWNDASILLAIDGTVEGKYMFTTTINRFRLSRRGKRCYCSRLFYKLDRYTFYLFCLVSTFLCVKFSWNEQPDLLIILYFPVFFCRRPGISSTWSDLLNMLPQHLKQIRVLMLNDKENLQRTLFRLEQGKAMFRHTDTHRQICVGSNVYVQT